MTDGNIDLPFDDELPQLEEGQFPPEVRTEEERRRFRLAWGVAEQIFGEDGQPAVWQAARSIYRSDMPT
jgi:hypothetical protein